MRKAILVVVSLFLSAAAFGQIGNGTAADLDSNCSNWSKLKLNKEKNFRGDQDAVYRTGVCYGYMLGLIDGMDGWIATDNGRRVTIHVKKDDIKSTWDVITAFHTHLERYPLDKGKPAWSVLQTVLRTNGLMDVTPIEEPLLPASN